MPGLGGADYGAFIVPGPADAHTAVAKAPRTPVSGSTCRKFTGAIYELLSAPVGVAETLIGFVGAAAAKSLILAAIILTTAALIVDYHIAHPILALGYIMLVAAAFSLFGFILGMWADGFEKLQIVPMLMLMPLTFLGGTFYSIDVLPEPWRSVALVNPIVYLVSGLRWTFLGTSDFPIMVSFAMTLGFLALCVAIIAVIFRTGWRLRE